MKAFDSGKGTKYFEKLGYLIYDMPEFYSLIITSTEEAWLPVILDDSYQRLVSFDLFLFAVVLKDDPPVAGTEV